MSPDLWQQVKPILSDALELEPDKRSIHVQRRCNGNTELAREVNSLLEVSWTIDDDFIEVPALELVSGELTRA